MKLGFIGCGNMASAMIKGIIDNDFCKASDIIVSAKTEATVSKAKEAFHVNTTLDNKEVAASDIVVLSVKPIFYDAVINEIKDVVNENQLIISIAPGKTLEWMKNLFGKNVKIVRSMPNTPALVGEGMSALCKNEFVNDADLKLACDLFNSFGICEVIEERLMDVVVSASGSSPAYVFMFMEAMADAAVADGMPRAQAYKFVAQSVLGSAKMMLETGSHPGELKDMVCSPGGTTIEAVRVLEREGMRSAVIEAMKACTDKARGN
ncbi:MAG: pyrroline-5-carboxylate reductase [Lachnospiraceae bacterium]|nr:pyrroline-5-carboxylate reductase [Lachnospiraceae bacterium]